MSAVAAPRSGFAVDLKDRLDTADLAALSELTANEAQVLGYHAPAYQSGMEAVLGDRCHHILVRGQDGRLAAYLPFRERMGSAGTVLNALPFFGPNGLLLAADGSARDTAIQAFRTAAQRADVLSAALYTPFLEDGTR